ncbi:kua-ubiquitin conjugating enzyme hybrid localization domain protein [Lujinxingia vulgaris]|uniref:Kua-ubiquitin conjugating enzyme hybrid localization domain protein n=2 Tax=Lujinxingia vulgaris TaxID=2600176 RepID=A0A5C6WZ35_9DELT|nr:kua-ubiquitin conjugating enzyme hybrid localization domain protein [Lujinxingia vulgaris]
MMPSMIKSFFSRDFDYSPLHRILEIVAILSFFALVVVISARAISGLSVLGWQTAAWLVPLTAVLGYVGADFASGFVHWMGDTFGSEETPVLGERFVKPFRDHHTHPQGICEHDYVTVNGNNSIVLALYMVPIALFFTDPTQIWQLLVLAFSVTFTCGVFMTNQFHKWAHMDNPPGYILFLQRYNLILTPTNHDFHHTAPYDTYYCITCGWLNPVLERLKFFETLENVARSAFGIKTVHDEPDAARKQQA